MTQSAAYCLSGAHNSKLIISHDELRSLFTQVESEFCQSDIYQKAFQGLHKRLGSAPKWLRPLIRAIGREAIRLTLRQLVLQYQDQAVFAPQTTNPSNDESSTPSLSEHERSEHRSSHLSSSSQSHRNADSPEAEARASSPVPELVQTSTDPIAKEPDQAIASSLAVQSSPHPDSPSDSISQPSSRSRADAQKVTAPVKTQSNIPETRTAEQSTAMPASMLVQQSVSESSESDPALRTIGEALKQARLEKGLSIEEVYAQTRVAPYQIEAIEAGRLDKLPEKIYVKGFIRQIALLLGIDYPILMQHWPKDPTSTHHVPVWAVPAAKPNSKQKSMRPAHLYLGYAALMASAAGGLVWANQTQSAVSLEELELPIDLPDVFGQLTSRFNKNNEGTQRSRYQRDQANSGAIASPEVLTVESSSSNP